MSTWIFLRGLARESRHWGSFPETFCREVPDVQVHCPDFPGNGRLNALKSPIDVDAMAEFMRAHLAGQGIMPPYHLLAMSLGAMAAISWAARYPDEIRGCVLINSSLRTFSPFHQRLKPGNYSRLLKLALPGSSAQDWESTILELTSRHAEFPAEVLKNWVAYCCEYPVKTCNVLRQLLAAALYRAPRTRPAAPLLILSSRQDALVDSACSRQIAAHWQASLAEHPTAGHDLPLDDGLWVARQVRQWLQEPPRQLP